MAAATVQSSTNLFRRLTWNATVPIQIRLADGQPGAGGQIDRYYIQAPRNTYLPLLLPAIRENFVELVVDDEQLAKLDQGQWWFEEDPEDGDDGRVGVFASQGPCKWNYPIDLLELQSTISRPARRAPPGSSSGSGSGSPSEPARPLRLLLHLSGAPADRLTVPPGVEACKTQFLNQIKEADFVRWGNTKRVTGLRRSDVEAGWDGVVSGDFDLHARMANRIVPLPIPQSTPPTSGGGSQFASGSASASASGPTSRPGSTEPGATAASREPKPESAYSARSLPIKIYLPDNAPAIQHVVPPLRPDGRPTTLLSLLRTHIPLLFPDMAEPYTLAQPVAQGIVVPPDADVAWLAACMAGADGWLRIGIRVVGE